jgi:hypothetical protein
MGIEPERYVKANLILLPTPNKWKKTNTIARSKQPGE